MLKKWDRQLFPVKILNLSAWESWAVTLVQRLKLKSDVYIPLREKKPVLYIFSMCTYVCVRAQATAEGGKTSIAGFHHSSRNNRVFVSHTRLSICQLFFLSFFVPFSIHLSCTCNHSHKLRAVWSKGRLIDRRIEQKVVELLLASGIYI